MTNTTYHRNDGPGLSLSVLYEANDLLNAMRMVDTEGTQQMSPAAWTLGAEVKRRLDSAIAHLDGSVPEIHDDEMRQRVEANTLAKGKPDPAEAVQENCRRIKEMAEPGEPAAELADEMLADLDEAEAKREASGNISAGTPYDDLMLRLERANTVIQAITDVVMSGEVRNLVSLTSIARSEIAAADRICTANSKRWGAA